WHFASPRASTAWTFASPIRCPRNQCHPRDRTTAWRWTMSVSASRIFSAPRPACRLHATAISFRSTFICRDMTMRILIVDDEPLARTRLEGLLAQCDPVELVASLGDAEQALACCLDNRPDLLVADIDMPALSGTQLAQRLAGLR